MMSSQYHLLPKVGVEGELMSMKSLSPKIVKHGIAFLLNAHCLVLPKAQSSHSLKVLVIWIPRALSVAWAMDSEECLSSMCSLLIFFMHGAIADFAPLLCIFQRNSTPATQPSWALILQSRMILPFVEWTTTLFWWPLDILFLCKSLHVREDRFAHTLGQNFTGHRMCTCSVPLTCHAFMHTLPFFVAGIIPELPWIDSLMSVMSYIPVSLLVIWNDAPESPIQAFLVNE